ncbi:cholesterol oxidase [Izhakiella capsodis]|uniref:Cholesterol oxidase n=1 Tax=Izhakiella capsodis TaxID=1367852 RepID=A0A1I4X3U3_9GAMM|nr:GMC oxidoreductase [Izhakiella capsodis]SFN20076.1 cholesterol oxidase [Izhakiella capsodis]
MSIFNKINFYKKTVPEIFEQNVKAPDDAKVVIIGSGFGGAVTALRLAEAGIKSVVLERGFRWPKDDQRKIFTNETLPDGRGFWHKKGFFKALNTLPVSVDDFGGVVDVTSYENIDVWRGACVGGGSMVYTGVMIQPERQYFDQLFEGRVDYDEMSNIFYPKVRKALELSKIPDDIYESSPFGHSRVWDEQSRKAGYEPYKVDSVFNENILRKELDGECRASAIIGESTLGNSDGAKFDLTQNYLLDAEYSGMTAIYPGQIVDSIISDDDGYRIQVKNTDPEGNILECYNIKCDYIFFAAGSIGTSELLVKAKALNTIKGMNEHVGKGWGTNGDALVVRSFSQLKGLTQAAPCVSKIDDATSSAMPATLENWYAPGIPVNIGIAGSLGMAFDLKNRAEFKYNEESDSVDLLWPENGNDEAVDAIRKVNNKICRESLSIPGVPLLVPDVSASFTAHPLGGMVLGMATDNYGRIHGAKNLYVMDGAALPGSAGLVNPSLTIAALAERNIQEIIKNDFPDESVI